MIDLSHCMARQLFVAAKITVTANRLEHKALSPDKFDQKTG
jgi:hypothetical protein